MTATQKKNTYTILHLTDLHFGSESSAQQQHRMADQRPIAFRSFLEALQRAVSGESADSAAEGNAGWNPDAVVISGDLAFSGRKAEYLRVGQFVSELTQCLRPSGQGGSLEFIACPGNHDRNSGPAGGLTYPNSDTEADEWLAPDQFVWEMAGTIDADNPDPKVPFAMRVDAPNLLRPFSEFVRFCHTSQFLRPSRIQGLDFLTGIAVSGSESRIAFVVLNSAWFCNHRGADFGDLWLGLPLLERLDSQTDLLPYSVEDESPLVRVALVHHTREWLNQAEINSYSDRPNTYRFLSDRVDVILSGHVHGALEFPSRAFDQALVFTGGATYDTGRYRNNFSLLQIDFDDRTVRRRGFEYDPRVQRWKEEELAQGVFPLRRLQAHKPADRRIPATDLVGSWRAVYWHESSKRSKKFEHRVVITLAPVATNGVTGTGKSNDDTVAYELTGTVENGFLTGTWKSSDSAESELRNGVFQFRIERRGRQMTGRWLGFDRHDTINYGQWKLWKEGT